MKGSLKVGSMIRKLFTVIIISLALFFSGSSFAQQSDVNVYVFWSDGCPHCREEEAFLVDLVKEKPNVKVKSYEVSKSFSNSVLFSDIGKYLDADTRGVPFTVIGSNHYAGFGSAETTGKVFIELIESVESGEDYDILEKFFKEREGENVEESVKDDDSGNDEKDNNDQKEPNLIPDELNLPLVGNINPKTLSLPVLTVVIAVVDGFNPCAMWVLLFLISLLLGFKDRKRMWILGLTFIAASAFVYFLFMAAWLNFFLFFGFIVWVRILVGLVALYFGYRNIKSYFDDKAGGCEVTKDEKRIKTLQKIKDITQKENLVPALAGIILLAFAINLIEAVCSAGLPAIYTQILTMNDLSTTQYYLHIIFYQIIFMLDDMTVFVIAMVTLNSIGIESKYARWSKVIGGVIMLLIGLLLILKPELLLFG